MKNIVSAVVRRLRPRTASDSQSHQQSKYTKPPPNPNRDFKAAFEGAGVTGYETY